VRISSAVLLNMKGSQLHPSMNRPMASTGSRTERWVPRRMAWRVMIPKKISTMLSHESDVGLKCRVEQGREVAAFPGPRLRHFQKQGSVEEELKRSGGRVQVELKLRGTQVPK
jgi:hypothetical protein